ncbi:MAG: hypothetical protein ABUL72_02680 [Armatimonadota bacterium]
MLSTVPARALVFGATWADVAVSIGWGALSLALSRMFWRRSLWKYSSASS